jgi:hypothetical protein
MYFTPDWDKSRVSVELLAQLQPELAVTGHGRAMQGAEMRKALNTLAQEFDPIAVPSRGKYALNPATVEAGTVYRQP